MTTHHGLRSIDIYRAVQNAIDQADLNDGSNDCHVGLHLQGLQGTLVQVRCRDHDKVLGSYSLRTGAVHWYVERCPLHPDEVAE